LFVSKIFGSDRLGFAIQASKDSIISQILGFLIALSPPIDSAIINSFTANETAFPDLIEFLLYHIEIRFQDKILNRRRGVSCGRQGK
jgi:hypothetical protein